MTHREMLERDLYTALEDPNGWGMPVELIAPDGKEYKTSKNSPDPLNPLPLCGQVHSNTVRMDPNTGAPLVTPSPTVALRISSLERVPTPGEKWGIRFPTTPKYDDPKVTYVISPDRSLERNSSLGFIVLYPQKAVQSV